MTAERYEELTGRGAACRQFDLELAAHLEGEERPAVIAHARECPFCRVVLADFEGIRAACRELPLEEPPARVWAHLHAALVAEGAFPEPVVGWQVFLQQLRFFPSPAPVAAMACLLVLGSALLVTPRAPDQILSSYRSPASEEAVVASAGFSSSPGDLARTVQELETSYKARANFIEPEVKESYEAGLKHLDNSIRECLVSIQHEPDNTLAHEYLLDAYTRKAEVLAAALEFDAR